MVTVPEFAGPRAGPAEHTEDPVEDSPAAAALEEGTRHRFSRNGLTLPLRIVEIGERGQWGHMLVFGDPRPDDHCLVRIHSRCLYGESLRSDDCDCGPELDLSLDLIGRAGSGVLIYLEQEGRGTGLVAKARGYRHCQHYGVDTFTAYQELGYPADARTYTHAVDSLRDLGLTTVRLLTNNPDKKEAVERGGITVTVENLHCQGLSEGARTYLDAKRRLRGHMIPADLPGAGASPEPGPAQRSAPRNPAGRPDPVTTPVSRLITDIAALVALVAALGFLTAGHPSASLVTVVAAAVAVAVRSWYSVHEAVTAGVPARVRAVRARPPR
jgi:3,4-dihydroxy 2-butanone 4-phosphate synthase/GTP cyclohydrolase II